MNVTFEDDLAAWIPLAPFVAVTSHSAADEEVTPYVVESIEIVNAVWLTDEENEP